jgi:L-ectoine synthase
MIVRSLQDIKGTGRVVSPSDMKWISRRLLLREDRTGFSFHDTTIRAGTRTLIHYRHHVETVYCVEGKGEVELIDEGRSVQIRPGTIYVLDRHEKHYLKAETEMRILCIFVPPLEGGEVHRSDGSYEPPREDGKP